MTHFNDRFLKMTILTLALFHWISVRALTVDEAYKAIPHDRTVFDPKTAKMSPSLAQSLDKLFSYIDEAIVLKMETIQQFSSPEKSKVLAGYPSLIRRLESENFPPEISEIASLTIAAVKDQYDFLNQLAVKELNYAHPLVRSSSSKLHQAYEKLSQKFSTEDQKNRKAFFDYLCALDFT